jgi:hypothetical protein
VTSISITGVILPATATVPVKNGTFAVLGVAGKTSVSGYYTLSRPEAPPRVQAGSGPDTVIVKFTSSDPNYTSPAAIEVVIPTPGLRDITGVIKSRTGGGVPNYEVQLMDLSTGHSIATRTDAHGIYHFLGGEGPYKLLIGTKQILVPTPGTSPSNEAGA